MAKLDEYLSLIESCRTITELRDRLHEIAQGYGFDSFSFIDVRDPTKNIPFFVTTVSSAWDSDYRANGFVHVDPILPVVRRSNLPFSWSDVPLPDRRGKRKPGGVKVLEAARDHGFLDGFVIPIHSSDRLGRVASASCVFFWKDASAQLQSALTHAKHDLHLLMLYWAQKVIDIAENETKRGTVCLGKDGQLLRRGLLTDRERDVLAWAARGKTMAETADILGISNSTVEDYVRAALRKLDAVTKAQAVAKAIYSGLIDV